MSYTREILPSLGIVVIATDGLPEDRLLIATNEALVRAIKEWAAGKPITPPQPHEAILIKNIGGRHDHGL